MQSFRVPKPEPQEVDVIVAGGGPAGCVVAGRLAKADPNLQVMLIEYGPNNIDDPMVSTPAVYPRNMRLLESDKAHFYYDTNKSQHLRGRKTIVPCAKRILGPCIYLGGGSSINFQMYTRASASDWNDFKTEGWNHQDLLPLMKRLENYQKPCNNANCQQSHAAEIWAKWINKDTGRRSDAASAYVHPIMAEQNNLHLRCNSKVARVIFEGNKAVGIAYVNSRDHGQTKTMETIVKARKMVVLTAGTLSTPQILERSGIGGKNILDKAGVKTLVDLPGVGKQYQDHYTTFSVFRARASEPTADDWLRGDPKVQEEWMRLHATTGKGPAASNGIDAGFKIRPTEEELKEMGPEFQKAWDSYFKDKPDKPVMFASVVNAFFGDHTLVPPGKYFSMFQYLEYPFSRGSIHISSSDPYADPIFDSGFLNHEADIAPIRQAEWSYKKVREVARRMDAYRGELTALHPHFHPDSPAACEDVDLQTAKEYMPAGQLTVGIHMGSWSKPRKPLAPGERRIVEDVKYSKEDDEAIEYVLAMTSVSMSIDEAFLHSNWVRDHVETTWHSLGTCAMKPRDQEGVLDPRLNVYGTTNLKVGDLSLCPDNLGTNTYSSALLCGEKCADLIAEELGLTITNPHIPVMRRASAKQH
ncbi:unnamed protein product [Rhizoctonia solani]|uniref:Glucose-methanol-choline oxidoreductase N-terminal domain-containing protein n=1 Tax=Rhizoctonia solani TaxID=456999 RepID=A0A8H2X7F7_9AGAM|nr:unnamed protein product [Rhizoctonia solani]